MATILILLRKYWKPLAMLTFLILLACCSYQKGVEHEGGRWRTKWAVEHERLANDMAAASEAARDREHKLADDFAAAADKTEEKTNETIARRDRIIADLRAGRLRVPSCPATVPEATADSGEPEKGTEGGQPGLVAIGITERFAECDTAINERNQAVRLMESERD